MSEAELNLELLLGRRPKSVALVSGATGALSQRCVFARAIYFVHNKVCGYSDEMRADTCANVSNPINGREAP